MVLDGGREASGSRATIDAMHRKLLREMRCHCPAYAAAAARHDDFLGLEHHFCDILEYNEVNEMMLVGLGANRVFTLTASVIVLGLLPTRPAVSREDQEAFALARGLTIDAIVHHRHAVGMAASEGQAGAPYDPIRLCTRRSALARSPP